MCVCCVCTVYTHFPDSDSKFRTNWNRHRHCFANRDGMGMVYFTLRISMYLIEKQYHNAEPPAPTAIIAHATAASYLFYYPSENCFQIVSRTKFSCLHFAVHFILHFHHHCCLFLERFLIYTFLY